MTNFFVFYLLSKDRRRRLADSCLFWIRFLICEQVKPQENSDWLPLFYFSIQLSLFNRNTSEEWGKGGDDESPDATWLHQIQPSSRQELICLNPSHCSNKEIWTERNRPLRAAGCSTLSRYVRRGQRENRIKLEQQDMLQVQWNSKGCSKVLWSILI